MSGCGAKDTHGLFGQSLLTNNKKRDRERKTFKLLVETSLKKIPAGTVTKEEGGERKQNKH